MVLLLPSGVLFLLLRRVPAGKLSFTRFYFRKVWPAARQTLARYRALPGLGICMLYTHTYRTLIVIAKSWAESSTRVTGDEAKDGLGKWVSGDNSICRVSSPASGMRGCRGPEWKTPFPGLTTPST
jgi:hypothetical protein